MVKIFPDALKRIEAAGIACGLFFILIGRFNSHLMTKAKI